MLVCVDQLVPRSRCVRQNTKPAERVDLLVFGAVGGRNRLPSRPVEAIRADDIVALNGFQRSVAFAAELDHGVVGIDVANCGTADAKDDVSALRHPAAD